MRESRENARYLPGVALPDALEVTDDLAAALHGADLALLAVPAQSTRELAVRLSPLLGGGVESKEGEPQDAPHSNSQLPTLVVIAAKGLEVGSGRRMTEV